MDNRWFIFPPDINDQLRLSAALGIESTTAQILLNRGYKTINNVRQFLEPSLTDIPDPFLFPDMHRAVERISSAIKHKERIAIYGDYDADGLTGTALMVLFLSSLGHEPIVFIPNRLTDGYGLNCQALHLLKTQGASLVITVDCGTRSVAEIEYARRIGLDIIITDHHEVTEIPQDCILLNPKRPDGKTQEMEIAGCAVAFLLAMAIRKNLREEGLFGENEPNLREHLDLVALGTIADVVPLVGINRIFAKFGLQVAQKSAKVGIRSLIKVCGLADMPLKPGNIAFRIAPRLNAPGRLGDAAPSLELLTTFDDKKAASIAQVLNTSNADRQRLEEQVLSDATQIIERYDSKKAPAIVVAKENWHAGVIGIVASKIVDRYARPAVVIAIEKDLAKGSARSVNGLNIVKALSCCSDLLLQFGGHSQAAGLQLHAKQIDAFRSSFEKTCAQLFKPPTKPILSIDAKVGPQNITEKLTCEIEKLEPFGLGNPEPTLCVENLVICGCRTVGTNHLKLRLSHKENNTTFDAIGFDMGNKVVKIGEKLTVAFTPQMNLWNGNKTLQLKIKDFVCLK